MEKEFDSMNERIAGCICKGKMYEQVDCGVHGIYAVKAKSFIHSYTRTLLESFGEEIISPVIDMELHEKRKVWEAEQDGFDEAIRRVDEMQRLKVKEILSNLK